jgi:hypothetical protein
MDPKILITGDYLHRDFKNLLTSGDSNMLAPIRQALRLSDSSTPPFDLIVVAQSFPEQFSPVVIEHLQSRHPRTPIVAVLGSWCEGETRSGKPWPGVVRIYWHQWLGRFDLFRQQLKESNVTLWHEPRTATVADRILRIDEPQVVLQQHQRKVGISANNSTQFEMLQDAFRELGYYSFWIELLMDEPLNAADPDLVCVDASHLNQELKIRIGWLREKFPEVPQIVVCNFPRANEVQDLIAWKVARVISKPFELHDLEYSVKSVLPA